MDKSRDIVKPQLVGKVINYFKTTLMRYG